jgi:hypothetical protein
MFVRYRRDPFLSGPERKVRLFCLGLGLAGIFLLSIWDPLTQPGPTVCMLRRVTGLPCPSCGMTRGVALCLRGHPLEATGYNPLTLPVLVGAFLLAIKWSYECLTGTRLVLLCSRPLRRFLFLLFGVVVLLNWTYMLLYRREDSFAGSALGQLLR